MTRTIISPSDLSQRTREILDRVEEGELAVVASGGEERIVLLDALDYRLLRALAVCATGEDVNGGLLEARVLRDYLAEKINLRRPSCSSSPALSSRRVSSAWEFLFVAEPAPLRMHRPKLPPHAGMPEELRLTHVIPRRHDGPEQLCSGPAAPTS